MTDLAVAPDSERFASPTSVLSGAAGAEFLTRMVEKGTLAPARTLLLSADLGVEALTLARLGFKVTVIDPRREAIDGLSRSAREASVELDVFRGEFFRASPSLFGPIELIVDRSFYASLPPAERADWAFHAGRLLPPGGKLAGLFLIGRSHAGPPYPVTSEEFRRSLERLFTTEILEPAGDGEPGRPQVHRALFRRR
jgi:hypothetical protein